MKRTQTLPGQSVHFTRHSVPLILFRTNESSGYLDRIAAMACISHGGAVAGDAEAPEEGAGAD